MTSADPAPVDVLAAPDPVAAVLVAHAYGRPIAVRTSGTTSRPRAVVRTTGSWFDSFPAYSRLSGVGAGDRVWLPGPLTASMNLFAAVHASWARARVVTDPVHAGHGCLTPAALITALTAGVPLTGRQLVVAGDRLPRDLADRAAAAGAVTAHYYGAAELSFLAWGSADDDLRAFPGVELDVRDGVVWARSPFVAEGYADADAGPADAGADAAAADGGAPLLRGSDGFATVGDRAELGADGVLTVLGRGDAAIVTAGATVLVVEVEQALRRAGAGDVVVIGVPHPRLGRLVAAVGADPIALAAARASGVAEFSAAQRPRLWLHAAHWPTTPAGKLDRAALTDLAAAGRLPRLAPSTPSTPSAPIR